MYVFSQVNFSRPIDGFVISLKNSISLLFILFSLTVLLSCGSDHDDAKISGQFVDDQVEGISYSCVGSPDNSVTTGTGQFVCYEYANVTFSLGDITLGTIPAQNTLVTPFTLFQNDFDAAINLARLLQSIDADGDPDNGKILLDENLVDLLPANTDFSSPDFVSDIEAALGITLVPAQQALENLTGSIVQFTSVGNLPNGAHLPLADAGQDQGVITGDTVTLDASGSYDEDGDTLIYSWGLTRPAGSNAQIADYGAISTSFVADIAGVYEVILIVYDGLYTNHDRITITANDAVAVPTAPQGLQAAVSGTQVSLSWNAVSGATAYTVYWNTTGGVSRLDTAVGAGSNTLFNFFGQTGQAYYFKVSASNASGEGPLSSEVSATPVAVPELSGLSLSNVVLSPPFASTVTSYSATVDNVVTSITVTPTTSDANASITVNGSAVTSGSASGAINLNVGSNSIAVVITAQDGVTSSTYNLSVTRDAPISSNAELLNLTLSAASLDQVFQSSQLSYTATVAYTVASISVTPTTADANATVTVNGTAVTSGSASSLLALNEGANVISVAVTAQDGSTRTYSITVTRQSAITFAQQAYIKASNTDSGDYFGMKVALDGDTLAVAAQYEASSATGIDGDQSDNSLSNAGAVYVFIRSNGVWSLQAYVKASNTENADGFGTSVALDGDTLAVGARWERSSATGIDGDQTDNSAFGAGAVYVYTRSSGVWSQQAYVKASNTEASDTFGDSVALSGDTLAVGATGEDSSATGIDGSQSNNLGSSTGAVYVFTRSNGVWSQQAYVKAGGSFTNKRFGAAVSLSGDSLAVSAPGDASSASGIDGIELSSSCCTGSGAAYVFIRSNGIWSQQAYIKASNPDKLDNFGHAISLSGDTLAVGAFSEDSSATGIDGNQADNTAPGAGAVYVFTRIAGTWSQQAYIKASNTDDTDLFGVSVGLDVDTLVVGAELEDSIATGLDGDQMDNSLSDGAGQIDGAGAAYLFTRVGGVWSQQSYVKASNTGKYDRFGHSLAMSADTVAVGAYAEDSLATGVDGDQSNDTSTDSGAVYVFQ